MTETLKSVGIDVGTSAPQTEPHLKKTERTFHPYSALKTDSRTILIF
mgnify:CR=1 FL=1